MRDKIIETIKEYIDRMNSHIDYGHHDRAMTYAKVVVDLISTLVEDDAERWAGKKSA